MSRPQKPINWEIVEKKVEAGCSGVEIAAFLRIDSDTFYNRFKEQYNKSFTDYSADLFRAGDSNIKFTQYMKAISGNIPMLILLGKERLGQGKEVENISPNEDAIIQRHENMLLKAELQELKQKIESLEGRGLERAGEQRRGLEGQGME